MRLGKLFFLLGFTVYSSALFSAENTTETRPFDIFYETNAIGKSHYVKPHSWKHEDLSYSESKGMVIYTHPLNKESGLKFGVGYAHSKLNWDHNPDISQKNFDNVLFSIGGYTFAQEKWCFDANLASQTNERHISLSRYTFFQGFLHGKYDWKKRIHLHVGICGSAGMHYTYILPIFGFDYQATEKLKFNAIFPSNVSAIYSFNPSLSVATSFRYFLSRQRLGTDENKNLRRGLVAYRSLGLEVGINYVMNNRFFANLHVGESFGGAIRVSRRHDRHRRHYATKPAPYIGLSAILSF